MKIKAYNRIDAVNYAKEWAFKRNNEYYDFSIIGGDCTNFASQCLYAGSKIMNDTKNVGWYYYSLKNRSPSWTGVRYFYDFLINNGSIGVGNGVGPFGKKISLDNLKIGDFVQLGNEKKGFYHTLIVVGFIDNIPLTASHSFDSFNRKLSSYNYDFLRCISIDGVKTIY